MGVVIPLRQTLADFKAATKAAVFGTQRNLEPAQPEFNRRVNAILWNRHQVGGDLSPKDRS